MRSANAFLSSSSKPSGPNTVLASRPSSSSSTSSFLITTSAAIRLSSHENTVRLKTQNSLHPLVERQSRYLMLAKVGRKDTETVVSALIKHAHKLPSELYKSLTWDRGKEMSNHRRFTLATDIKVYFCDPQSPWQRGSNENTNGLLRQYLPKGIDLSTYSQPKLNAIARRLNERPRKTLDFQTPAQRFHQSVASTGCIRTPQTP